MNAAFFHDTRLIQGSDEQVYSIGFSYNIWQRYLEVFDSIVVSTRMSIDNSDDDSMTKDMKLSSGPGVKFRPITKYKKNSDVILNNRAITNQVRETLEVIDCAIIRLPSMIGNIACNEARKLGIPYLIELVGCPWDAFWNHSIKGKFVAPFMYAKTKKNVKDANYVLYVTNEFLQTRYPSNGKTLGCSDVALPPRNIEILEKRLDKIKRKVKEKPIILGTTAAVDVKYKGQEYVIEAISKLNNEGYNFEYHLVGGGDNSFLKTIAKKHSVKDKVVFLGSVPHDKVFAYLDNIDIYIQPSLTEGLPRALVEAMSRGCPSLGSATGGIPELLNKEFIFKNGAVNEICELLKKMDTSTFIEEAERSFNKAKEYEKALLDKKREVFYREYAERVESND